MPGSGNRPMGSVLAPRRANHPVWHSESTGMSREQEAGQKAGIGALAKRTFHEIVSDDIAGQAAKVAYYAFMAMPPALMALFALAGLFGSEKFAAWLLAQAGTAMPGAIVDGILRPFVQQVVLKSAPGPLSVGLILALWGASGVFTGLMVTLNVAYDIEEERSFIRKKMVALGTMLAATALFFLAAVALLVGPELAKLAGLGAVGQLIWTILRWPLTFLFVVGAFWIVYYLLPNRDQKGYSGTILKAAAVAAVLWVLASAVFRLYIANFTSYSETYGFLGAFIILLLWLYVTGLVVLAGGELASEMERGSESGG
jgi:membrane protein